jgi:hypothetical protein
MYKKQLVILLNWFTFLLPVQLLPPLHLFNYLSPLSFGMNSNFQPIIRIHCYIHMSISATWHSFLNPESRSIDLDERHRSPTSTRISMMIELYSSCGIPGKSPPETAITRSPYINISNSCGESAFPLSWPSGRSISVGIFSQRYTED